MCNKRNYNGTNNPSVEINTRNDGNNLSHSSTSFSHVNASVESGGTTPIDITLMTGNNQNKEGE